MVSSAGQLQLKRTKQNDKAMKTYKSNRKIPQKPKRREVKENKRTASISDFAKIDGIRF